MKFLGAKLTVVASDSVGMSVQLTEDMIAAAARLAKKPGCYWTDQLNNTDSLAAYHRMADKRATRVDLAD